MGAWAWTGVLFPTVAMRVLSRPLLLALLLFTLHEIQAEDDDEEDAVNYEEEALGIFKLVDENEDGKASLEEILEAFADSVEHEMSLKKEGEDDTEFQQQMKKRRAQLEAQVPLAD